MRSNQAHKLLLKKSDVKPRLEADRNFLDVSFTADLKKTEFDALSALNFEALSRETA